MNCTLLKRLGRALVLEFYLFVGIIGTITARVCTGDSSFCFTAYAIKFSKTVVSATYSAVVLRDSSDGARGAVTGTGLIIGSNKLTAALYFDAWLCVFK